MKHVVIVGGGPAGLASAAGLARRGVAYTLLERGHEPAAALRTIDPDMALFSPARLSRLRGMELAPAARCPTFRELVAALDRYRARHTIEVTTDQTVTAIERAPDGFVVRTASGGAFAGTHVINATGIAGAPRLPAELDRDAFRVPWLHSVDVRRPHVAASRRLLVVGAGASAAAVLEHWLAVRRPDDHAWIAARSKIRAMPQRVLGIDFHYWLWAIEHLPARGLAPPRDPMWGYAIPRAIRRGAIERVELARYEATAIGLADGRTIEPDLVVFATGFQHETRHLGELIDRDAAGWPIASRCESKRTPGVYVLGSRFTRSLASPTLRGIARDAELIADRIATRRGSP